MSLLLDALKKSGSAHQTGANGHMETNNKSVTGSLSEMSLEELPNKPLAAMSTTTSSNTTAASSTPNPSPRSTGENLFAAKKAPPRKTFQYKLGIVPTAAIIGLVLGIAGGVYVWIEIQPPKQVQRTYSAPAPVASTTPVYRPPQQLALPPETLPETAVPAKVNRPAPFTEARAPSSAAKRTPATHSAAGVQVQRQFENDGIYSTLTAAYQAYQKGDLETAWKKYREALLQDAKNRDALLGIAAIAQQQGQDDTAIQYYKQVLILDPRDPVALAGMSAFSTGDSALKESRLKLSLAQSPQSAALHFALGNIYTEQSRWGDAQQAYFNAYKLEPMNAQFAFNLATSLDHLGQSKLAAQYYGQALQIDTSGNSGFDRVQTQQRMNQLQNP